MILECKFCGAPLTDRHKIPGPTLQLKCSKCANITVVEPERAAALGFKPTSADSRPSAASEPARSLAMGQVPRGNDGGADGAPEAAPFKPGVIKQAPAAPPVAASPSPAAPQSPAVQPSAAPATSPPASMVGEAAADGKPAVRQRGVSVTAPSPPVAAGVPGNGGAATTVAISPDAFAPSAASKTAAARIDGEPAQRSGEAQVARGELAGGMPVSTPTPAVVGPVPPAGLAGADPSLLSEQAPEVDARTAQLSATTDQRHYLQKIRLFSQLSVEECLAIERCLKKREFPPMQTVVKEGGPGDSMFFINGGQVEVRKKDPNTGIDFLIAELRAGSCFGELALLTGKPRAATVMATESTTCDVLEMADFDDLLLSHPKIGLTLSRVLAERLEEASQRGGIEYINLSKLQFDERVLLLLPTQVMRQHKVLPVSFANNRLSLAMVNPHNLVALDDVRRLIRGVMIEPVVTSEDDFKRFMSTTYAELLKKEEEKKAKEQRAASAQAAEAAKNASPTESAEIALELLQSDALKSLEVDDSQQAAENVTDLSKSAEDAPIIRLANNILALAIKKGASDIHIEPQEKEVAVRFRIDGALQQVQVLPKKVQMGLISRLKILSKLDIAEKRLPQDGRISVRMEERPIDFRVSTIPSKWGEKICMRILDKSNTLLGLDKLILLPDALEQVRDMISQPYGIIYVTGPTGSGKTTSLYSALAELNAPDVNISTAEDPIEYDLPRINQVQAHKEIGLDFARILRAFLRQDPDIILVGETRDKETAHIAVEAALTGHLVFTTLHTNDAAGAFVRLNEMGVEAFLMSSSTIGVMAQRLTRRLCQSCKDPYTPDEISMKYLGLPHNPSITFYRKKGCEKCSGTGFKGRVGVYEVLRMNGELRKLIASGGKTEEITEAAVRNGMKTLKDYSVWLLKNGWTTMEEVLQVVAVHE